MASRDQINVSRDLSAYLQEGSRRFATLYEQQAYRVYNVALRITCEREAAEWATARIFLLSRLAEPGDDAGLAAMAARTALGDAKPNPAPSGAGAEESEQMLVAAAEMAPVERATLALAHLADLDTAAIAKALKLNEGKTAEVLERATAGFAERIGVEPDGVASAYKDWLWAQPPEAIWEDLYRRFYRALEHDARAALKRGRPLPGVEGPAAAILVTADETSSGPRAPLRARLLGGFLGLRRLRPRPIVAVRSLRSRLAATRGAGPRPPRASGAREGVAGGLRLALRVPLIPLLALGALLGKARAASAHGWVGIRRAPRRAAVIALVMLVGGFALVRGGGEGTEEATIFEAPAPGAADKKGGADPYDPLTPKELDKLRLAELGDLKQYAKDQEDKRLSGAERTEAARRAKQLIALARRRVLEAERAERRAAREIAARLDAANRRQERAERQRQQSGGGSRPADTDGGRRRKSDPSNPRTIEEAQQNCLQDTATGSFICPE